MLKNIHMIEIIKTLLQRDLNKLKQEIAAYQSEQNLWVIEKAIANSAGNLCLHLVGNLNTYIGVVFGKTDYVRNRELEFSLKNIPREDLIQKIDETIAVVGNSLDKIKEEDLKLEYPMVVFKEATSIEYMLIHLSAHLGYHLGQINYHRRLLDN